MYFLRFETCYQIALAIKKEVEDLEAGGIQVGTFVFVSHLISRSHVKHEYMQNFFFLNGSLPGHPN
jgi:methionine synthase II (cobalamin-independent)